MTASNGKSKTGIGAPLPRLEDFRFLTGQGRFADDIKMANVAYAHVVRAEISR